MTSALIRATTALKPHSVLVPRRERPKGNGPNPGEELEPPTWGGSGAEPLHYPTMPPAAGLFYFAHVLI